MNSSPKQDLKTLKLTPNSAPATPNSSAEATDRAQFVCALTLKEMNGTQPFVYISTCGCVFSKAGLKTMTSSKEKGKEKEEEGSDSPPSESTEDVVELCPNCGTKYSKEDVVPLNPSLEEEEVLRFVMERKRTQEPLKKKSKSKKRKNESPTDEGEPVKKKQERSTPTIHSGMISGTSRAVTSELEKEEVRRKANMSSAVKSLYGSGSARKETFMTRGTFTRVRPFVSDLY